MRRLGFFKGGKGGHPHGYLRGGRNEVMNRWQMDESSRGSTNLWEVNFTVKWGQLNENQRGNFCGH